jgi:hypothetical protein
MSALPSMTGSRLAARHAPYFVQTTQVGRELQGRPRLDVFAQMCAGQRVLHVGCVDWPITNLQHSLHLQLQAHCASLDGFDIHTEAFAQMQPHLTGRLFSDWSQVTGAYDIVLVPEVLEHVPDVQGFLQQLDRLDARHYVITVPDAFSCFHGHFEELPEQEQFVEVVHPDHNCWYTPYTFANVLRKYTPWTLKGMWFFNRISLLAIASKAAGKPAIPPTHAA